MPQPYFEYTYFAENDNKLHKNSYAGRYDRVIKHIRKNVNIYQRTLYMLETPLFLAISSKQTKVVNFLLDLYQCDLKFVEQKISSGGAYSNGVRQKADKFWLKRPILIAFGKEQCRLVDELYGQYEKFEKALNVCDTKKCVIVLLKLNNCIKQKVFVLSPETKFGKIVTLKIIKMVIENGFLDLNGCIRRGDSYIKVATLNGLFDILMRLITMGADCNIMDTIYTTMKAGQVECLDKLYQKFHFDVDYLVQDEMELFNLIGNDECPMYVYIVEKLIEKHNLQSDLFAVWKDMIDTRAPECESTIYHYALICNRLPFVEKLLCFKPDVIGVNAAGDIPIHNAFHNVNYKCFVKRMIYLDNRVLSIKNLEGKTALHMMAEQNWLGEFIEYYQRFSDHPKFFENISVGGRVLQHIVSNGYYDMAEFIIENEKTLITYDIFYNLLNAAAGGDNIKFIKYLLSMKFYDFLRPTTQDENPLITALIQRKPDNFILLRRYVPSDLNKIRDEHNNNLLKFAIWDRLEMDQRHISESDEDDGVNDLTKITSEKLDISVGIPELTDNEVNEKDKFNKIFETLINDGVDFYNVEQHTGMNLLHYCALQANEVICQQLLELGVDPTVADKAGNISLHYATTLDIFRQINSKTNGQFINYKNEYTGDTSLHSLMRNMNIYHPETDLLEFILNNGGDVAATNHKLETALHLVRSEEWCRILLSHNPDVNARDIDGCTPIHAAFYTLRYRIANTLLEHDSCDYLALDNKGVSYISGFMNDLNLHKKNFRLFPKVFDNNYPKFKQLLEVHCNSRNEFGTPVIIEAIYKNETICDWLLAQPNIDLNIRETETEITPLHATGKFGKNRIAMELLKRGLNVDILDANGNTPLHQACLYWYETGLIFVRNGANVNARNYEEATPLSLAAQIDICGTTICELLLHGADMTYRDSKRIKVYDALSSDLKKIFKFVL